MAYIDDRQVTTLNNDPMGYFSDGVLLYRDGDHFHCVGDDAETVGRVLDSNDEIRRYNGGGRHLYLHSNRARYDIERLTNAGLKVYVLDVFEPAQEDGE